MSSNLLAVKIKGVRIYNVVPVPLEDGSIGTEALIDPEDLPVLKKSGLLAWDNTQDKKDCPIEWKNKDGHIVTMWSGHENQVKTITKDSLKNGLVELLPEEKLEEQLESIKK